MLQGLDNEHTGMMTNIKNLKSPFGLFKGWQDSPTTLVRIRLTHCVGSPHLLSKSSRFAILHCMLLLVAYTTGRSFVRILHSNKKSRGLPSAFFIMGWQDSNLRMTEPKSVGLPLADTPISQKYV